MSRSDELFERAVKVIPGGVNSPVRAYGSVGMTPRFIEGATSVCGRCRQQEIYRLYQFLGTDDPRS